MSFFTKGHNADLPPDRDFHPERYAELSSARYRLVQQALMVDPQPRSTLKAPNGSSQEDEFDV